MSIRVATADATGNIFLAASLIPDKPGGAVSSAYDAETKRATDRGSAPVRGIWHRHMTADRHGKWNLVYTFGERAPPVRTFGAWQGEDSKINVAINEDLYTFDGKLQAEEAALPGVQLPSGRYCIGPVPEQTFDCCTNPSAYLAVVNNEVRILRANSSGQFVDLWQDQPRVASAEAVLSATMRPYPCNGSVCWLVALVLDRGEIAVVELSQDEGWKKYEFTQKGVPVGSVAHLFDVEYGATPRFITCTSTAVATYSINTATSEVQKRTPRKDVAPKAPEYDQLLRSKLWAVLWETFLAMNPSLKDSGVGDVLPQLLSTVNSASRLDIQSDDAGHLYRALWMVAWSSLVDISRVDPSVVDGKLAASGYVTTFEPSYLELLVGSSKPRKDNLRKALQTNNYRVTALRVCDAYLDTDQANFDASFQTFQTLVATKQEVEAARVFSNFIPLPTQPIRDSADNLHGAAVRTIWGMHVAQQSNPCHIVAGAVNNGTIAVPGGQPEALDVWPSDARCIVGETSKPYIYSCSYAERGVVRRNQAKIKKNERTFTLNMAGLVATEKFDGVRARWVPYSVNPGGYFEVGKPRDGPLTKLEPPRGRWRNLFSNVDFFIDGELWCGRGNFFSTMSTIRSSIEWDELAYVAFDSHDKRLARYMYTDRLAVIRTIIDRASEDTPAPTPSPAQVVRAHVVASKEHALCLLRQVTLRNGEGIVLRSPNGYADGPFYKFKVQREMTVTTAGAIRVFEKSGTCTCKAFTATYTDNDITVMGVPIDLAVNVRIEVAYNGSGSKGGILHARFERVAR